MSVTRSSSIRGLLLGLGLVLWAAAAASAQQKVLFDNSHAETAGNADWTISGAYSSFADALRQQGFVVEEHTSGPLKPEELIKYAVVVLPEPNSVFTASEQQALVTYVQQGGGLFAIADHYGSDRNHDGIDSGGVYNQFLPQLGFKCEQTKLTQAPVSGPYVAHPITAGVKAVGMWAGCTIALTQPSAKAVIFVNDSTGKPLIYCACNEIQGGGRVVAIGDSSPFDDGTGAPGNQLHDGWHQAGMQDGQLAVNAVTWLAHHEASPSSRVTVEPRAAVRVNHFAHLPK